MGRRGHQKGEKHKLTADQEKELRKSLIDKTPDQLKLPFALWTRESVCLLIKQKYGIELLCETLLIILNDGDLPLRNRLYGLMNKILKQFKNGLMMIIKSKAKQESAEIYWGDETGIQNNAYLVKGFAPKGNTPVINLNVNKSRISMVSAISNQGKV